MTKDHYATHSETLTGKPMHKKTLSIVIPAHNEEKNITKTCNDVIQAVPAELNYEIVVVDDGSKDHTVAVLHKLHASNPKIKAVVLSRNFGKEVATSAGIGHASGDALIMIDADGQHPPELIPRFCEQWEQGSQVVVGVRKSYTVESAFKKLGSKLFYVFLKKFAGVTMVPGSTDFRLLDKEVYSAFQNLKESNRITRGLVDWMGYKTTYITFSPKAREHGDPGYSTRKLIKLAINSVVSLSFLPLYIFGYLGVVITGLSLVAGIVVLIENYVLSDPLNWDITGSASLGLLILFLVGIILISQGIIALYISRIHEEVKDRPLYLVNKALSRL